MVGVSSLGYHIASIGQGHCRVFDFAFVINLHDIFFCLSLF